MHECMKTPHIFQVTFREGKRKDVKLSRVWELEDVPQVSEIERNLPQNFKTRLVQIYFTQLLSGYLINVSSSNHTNMEFIVKEA